MGRLPQEADIEDEEAASSKSSRAKTKEGDTGGGRGRRRNGSPGGGRRRASPKGQACHLLPFPVCAAAQEKPAVGPAPPPRARVEPPGMPVEDPSNEARALVPKGTPEAPSPARAPEGTPGDTPVSPDDAARKVLEDEGLLRKLDRGELKRIFRAPKRRAGRLRKENGWNPEEEVRVTELAELLTPLVDLVAGADPEFGVAGAQPRLRNIRHCVS